MKSTKKRWILYGILYFTLLFTLVPSLASAYIDPSVTTYAIQAIAGVVVAAGAFFATYGRKMKKRWMRILDIDENENRTMEAPLEVTREDLKEELQKVREARKELAAPAEKKKTSWKRRILVPFCCNLFLVLTVAFFLPLEVVLLNQRGFLITVSSFWGFQLLLSIAGALILTAVMAILPEKAGRILSALSLGGGIALWAQSLFMNGGMVSLTGEEMHVSAAGKLLNVAAWVIIIAGTVAAVFFFGRKRPKRTGAVMCLAATALTLIQTVAFGGQMAGNTYRRGPGSMLVTEGEFTLSSGDNVVEFVLDTVDETYFNRMLDRYPEMREELSGWVYYRNTTSTYSRTYPSISYLLTGQKCWFDKEYSEYVNEAFDTSDYLKRLQRQGTDIRIFTTDPELVGRNTGDYIANHLDYDYTDFRNLDLKELEKYLAHISLYKGAPYVLKNRFSYIVNWVNTFSFKLPALSGYTTGQDPIFYGELNKLGLKTEDAWPKAYRFYHLNGTHQGFDWGDQLEPSDSGDAVAALRGSFRIIRAYTDRMKELGIYDRATIIVTTDHGFSGGYGTTLDACSPVTPMILAKYPDSDGNQPLEISGAPVCHDDLFATIETALGVSPSGTGSGRTLREIPEDEDRPRLYYYSALYSNDDGEVALREYEINGDASSLANWKPTGNWWDIDYSENKVSEKRFSEEQKP